jgi:hypothetical protein
MLDEVRNPPRPLLQQDGKELLVAEATALRLMLCEAKRVDERAMGAVWIVGLLVGQVRIQPQIRSHRLNLDDAERRPGRGLSTTGTPCAILSDSASTAVIEL